MPVVNFSQFFNVPDSADWLDKLSAFLTTQGWTIVRDLRDVQWVITSGFVAGTEDFLEITSNGHGSQTIHIRMRFYNKDSPTVGSTRVRLTVGYGDTSLDTSTSIHPVDRYKNGVPFGLPLTQSQVDTNISNENMPQVYFFGFQQKYCCVSSVVSAEKVIHFEFGTIDLEDPSINYGDFTTIGGGVQDWKTINFDTPFDKGATSMRHKNGVVANSSNMKKAVTLSTNQVHTNQRFFPTAFYGGILSRISVKNTQSDLRMVIRNRVYMLDTVDGLWFQLGKEYVYRIWFQGMAIGERFFIGAEEYIALPGHNVTLSYHGVAFRIA